MQPRERRLRRAVASVRRGLQSHGSQTQATLAFTQRLATSRANQQRVGNDSERRFVIRANSVARKNSPVGLLRRPRSSADRALASEAMCAGSTPVGGTGPYSGSRPFFDSFFACFSFRFSLSDLPVFLVLCWLGDLLAIVAPLVSEFTTGAVKRLPTRVFDDSLFGTSLMTLTSPLRMGAE
jgi:hypothetical protein